MAILPAQRDLMLVEELETGAAASEGTVSKMGGNVNHLLLKPHFTMTWKINGPYSLKAPTEQFVDGDFTLPFFGRVVGYAMTHYGVGSSGQFEIDIQAHDPSVSPASIFSQRPALSYLAGANATLSKDIETPEDWFTPTGGSFTEATFASLSFNAGTKFWLNVTDRQIGGSNAYFHLFFNAR